MHLADLHVLNSPLAWLLWFAVLAVAMYFARLPAHRMLLSLARALHRTLRLAGRSVVLAEQRLQARNREVLLAAGREAKERIIEREFERLGGDRQARPAGLSDAATQASRRDHTYRGGLSQVR